MAISGSGVASPAAIDLASDSRVRIATSGIGGGGVLVSMGVIAKMRNF